MNNDTIIRPLVSRAMLYIQNRNFFELKLSEKKKNA